jgi:hypothetical protein
VASGVAVTPKGREPTGIVAETVFDRRVDHGDRVAAIVRDVRILRAGRYRQHEHERQGESRQGDAGTQTDVGSSDRPQDQHKVRREYQNAKQKLEHRKPLRNQIPVSLISGTAAHDPRITLASTAPCEERVR